MAQLVKVIQGEILPSVETDVRGLRGLYGKIQLEDFVCLSGFIAYLQNFSQIEKVTKLDKPVSFGLRSDRIIQNIDLEINY